MSEASVHPVDQHIGNRIRGRRMDLGMSQTTLGRAIGVSFQQVQKYERGSNRVSASMLYEIAGALETSISSLFSGLPAGPEGADNLDARELRRHAFIATNEGGSLVDSFLRLSPEAQHSVLGLFQHLQPKP